MPKRSSRRTRKQRGGNACGKGLPCPKGGVHDMSQTGPNPFRFKCKKCDCNIVYTPKFNNNNNNNKTKNKK